MLKGLMQLRILSIARVIHPFDTNAFLAEQLPVKVNLGSRTGKIG